MLIMLEALKTTNQDNCVANEDDRHVNDSAAVSALGFSKWIYLDHPRKKENFIPAATTIKMRMILCPPKKEEVLAKPLSQTLTWK